MIELLSTTRWQMTPGERAALEGILAQLQPALSIEIGTAEGGSLRRIAAHSSQVHSFDLVEPDEAVSRLPNVVLHTGDSHLLLDECLSELAREQLNVDFALVDGDHTADGVRRDVEALLESEAVCRGVILIHDTANEVVREGLHRVDYGRYSKIAYRDLDFLAGHLSERGAFANQLWGGLGLVVVDDGADRGAESDQPPSDFFSAFSLFVAARDRLLGGGEDTAVPVPVDGTADRERALADDLHRTRAVLDSLTGSASWRATAPLRALKRAWQRPRQATTRRDR